MQVKGGGVFEIFAKASRQAHRARHVYRTRRIAGTKPESFNGTDGWVTTPRALLGEYEVTGTELDGLHFDADLAFPGADQTIPHQFDASAIPIPSTVTTWKWCRAAAQGIF